MTDGSAVACGFAGPDTSRLLTMRASGATGAAGRATIRYPHQGDDLFIPRKFQNIDLPLYEWRQPPSRLARVPVSAQHAEIPCGTYVERCVLYVVEGGDRLYHQIYRANFSSASTSTGLVSTVFD